jgi:hypothetical protein
VFFPSKDTSYIQHVHQKEPSEDLDFVCTLGAPDLDEWLGWLKILV